jgi:hypothetical protein
MTAWEPSIIKPVEWQRMLQPNSRHSASDRRLWMGCQSVLRAQPCCRRPTAASPCGVWSLAQDAVAGAESGAEQPSELSKPSTASAVLTPASTALFTAVWQAGLRNPPKNPPTMFPITGRNDPSAAPFATVPAQATAFVAALTPAVTASPASRTACAASSLPQASSPSATKSATCVGAIRVHVYSHITAAMVAKFLCCRRAAAAAGLGVGAYRLGTGRHSLGDDFLPFLPCKSRHGINDACAKH